MRCPPDQAGASLCCVQTQGGPHAQPRGLAHDTRDVRERLLSARDCRARGLFGTDSAPGAEAWRVGLLQLNSITERIRDIWDSESRTPKRSATTFRIRPRVQSSVANPLARAPLSSTRFSSRRSALSSEGGRPRGPVERSASNPPCSRRLAHPQTVDRATPTRRATSACGTPFRRRRPARSRRLSNSLHCVLLSMESSQHTRFHGQRKQKKFPIYASLNNTLSTPSLRTTEWTYVTHLRHGT